MAAININYTYMRTKLFFQLSLMFFSSFNLLSQSNYLDDTFGVNGLIDFQVPNLNNGFEEYHGFDISVSGKIINLALGTNSGSNTATFVSQFLENGSIDVNFGTIGTYETSSILGFDLVSFNNNIYIAGISSTSGKLAVLSLDSNGIVSSDFGINGSAEISQNISSIGNKIILDSNNRIIVAGRAIISGEDQLIVTRFNNNGTLDSTFGTNGTLLVNVSPVITDEELVSGAHFNVSLFSDDSILISGDVYTPEDATPTGDYEYNEFATKITNLGAVDTSFGINGIAIYYDLSETSGGVYSSYILPNGKSLLSVSGSNGSVFFDELLRINIDGTIDTTFGINGLLSIQPNGFLIDKMFKNSSDNDILVLGTNNSDEVAIVKIDENGIIDTNYANNGIIPIEFPGIPTKDLISNATQLSDGKIIVSGFRENADGFLMTRNFTENQLNIANIENVSLSVSPNPASNVINISSSNIIERVKIYQINGKLISDQKVDLISESLNISRLNTGLYILKIFSFDRVDTFKFNKI